VADLSDIPDEAWIDVVAAVGWDESNDLWPVLQKAVAAALPVLNTAKDSETDALRGSLDRTIDDLATRNGDVTRLKRALAGHLFDGESVSTREAIRNELIEQAQADLRGAREMVSKLTTEDKQLRDALDSIRALVAKYHDRDDVLPADLVDQVYALTAASLRGEQP